MNRHLPSVQILRTHAPPSPARQYVLSTGTYPLFSSCHYLLFSGSLSLCLCPIYGLPTTQSEAHPSLTPSHPLPAFGGTIRLAFNLGAVYVDLSSSPYPPRALLQKPRLQYLIVSFKMLLLQLMPSTEETDVAGSLHIYTAKAIQEARYAQHCRSSKMPSSPVADCHSS
ncbi:hypothetical protein LZ32DRAFT_609090 [Colletotrichum eremochloae]|nr:hypothetical protein LZ32DRAFT_609090 [Colletotrichum eremochloae]